MPFCPNCGVEYREGFDTCADCDLKLNDSPPAELPTARPVRWVELARLSTLEADGMAAMLDSVGIDALRRPAEEGDVSKLYTGVSAFGEIVYVDEADLAAARDFLDARAEPFDIEVIEGMENPELDDYEPPSEDYEERRRRFGLILMLCWVIPLVAYFLYRFYSNMKGHFGQ